MHINSYTTPFTSVLTSHPEGHHFPTLSSTNPNSILWISFNIMLPLNLGCHLFAYPTYEREHSISMPLFLTTVNGLRSYDIIYTIKCYGTLAITVMLFLSSQIELEDVMPVKSERKEQIFSDHSLSTSPQASRYVTQDS